MPLTRAESVEYSIFSRHGPITILQRRGSRENMHNLVPSNDGSIPVQTIEIISPGPWVLNGSKPRPSPALLVPIVLEFSGSDPFEDSQVTQSRPGAIKNEKRPIIARDCVMET